MRLKTAVHRRIKELCAERDLSLCGLARKTGISHRTLSNILGQRNHSMTLHTLQRICEGCDITVHEFFDSDLFRDLEQEIE